MSLNKKTFIFTTIVVGLGILGVIATSQTILFGGFKEVENKLARRNAARAVVSVKNQAEKIDLLNSDWGHWDDAYKFVQDNNKEFINVNLTNSTLNNAGLNAIVFVDNEGKITYSKGFDPGKNAEVPVSEGLKSHINRSDLLITHVGKDSISGAIETEEGVMLVSSQPILRSDGSGPSKGTIVMATYLTKENIERISDFAQVPVDFVKIDSTLPPNFGSSDESNFLLKVTPQDKVLAYAPVFDIYGKPILAAKVELAREVVNQGNLTLSYFLLVVVLIGSIIIAGGVYFQNMYVLSPIYKLSDGLNRIRNKKDLSERVEVIGNDEIGRLSKDVNAMLTSLEEYNKEALENEKNLSEKLAVIEKQNQDLEKTKTAMMNLLEDEKELEETLRKEHDRLDLIISSMGEGLLVIDNNFNISMINPVAQGLLEVKAKDVLGKKWSDLAKTLKDHKETPTEERSFSKAITEGKTTVTGVEDMHNYKTKSGRVFPIVSITAPLKIEGKIVGAVKVFRDATKERQSRKLIEEEVSKRTRELWEERARMFASINSIQMGFIVADKDRNIIVKNPAVSELLKIPDGELTLDMLQKEFSANFDLFSECTKCLKGKTSFGKDDIYYKDKFLRVFLTPVVPEDENKVNINQEAIGFVLLIEDVTNEKQLARAKDEFFAVASHELRTPLTAIRGNTSLIMDYYAEKIQDKDLKEMISDMHESSIRLINIVNDFLDASRLEQGRVEFKKEDFDIVEVLKGSFSELDEFAKQKGLNVNLEDGIAPLNVVADKARTEQIITNLLGNAIKFTKQGTVKVSLTKNGKFAKVVVTDTGDGISPANQRLLFKKFQQAGERVLAREMSKGTGMGLYISKLLTEGMGGKIYLERSSLGKGSSFAFELPLKK